MELAGVGVKALGRALGRALVRSFLALAITGAVLTIIFFYLL